VLILRYLKKQNYTLISRKTKEKKRKKNDYV
jgi:hypothetical protein